jgi:hypothetical protein
MHMHAHNRPSNSTNHPTQRKTNQKQAHEVYLRTAIGNAPWPIGLTMVGIHERTGREKISSSKVRFTWFGWFEWGPCVVAT